MNDQARVQWAHGGGLRVEAQVRLHAFTLHAEFAAPPGLTVLFGPSGAGKSLALQAIAGLVPLTAGRIALGAQLLADSAKGLSLPPRLRRVGYVPQHYALFPHLTVAENVAYALPAPRHPWDRAGKARRAEQVADLLALARLSGFEDRWPRQLSGGQQQRVALARALAAEPAALLLDEPLGALDAPTRAAVQDDLRAAVLASGVPAIVVTHDLAEARALADRLVVLVEGRVAAQGAIADVLATPPSSEAALLLGWRNVFPISAMTPASAENGGGDRLRIQLACGQTLEVLGESLPVPSACDSSFDSSFPPRREGRQGGWDWAVALHADRLEILSAADAPQVCAAGHLTGTLRAVSDGGAYRTVRVALDGAATESIDLAVTCSPREWAALDIAPGARVAVRVPDVAARLVEAAPNGGAR